MRTLVVKIQRKTKNIDETVDIINVEIMKNFRKDKSMKLYDNAPRPFNRPKSPCSGQVHKIMIKCKT